MTKTEHRTREHARRTDATERRDAEFMRLRRQGVSSAEAAKHVGMSDFTRVRVEQDYQAEYGATSPTPANDDTAYVRAVVSAGGFGRYLERRDAAGKPRITGPFVPYEVERRAQRGGRA